MTRFLERERKMETLKKLIESLTQEAAQIQIQGRALRPDEMARVQAIHRKIHDSGTSGEFHKCFFDAG